MGILWGVATHGLFAVTVWYLYWFLKGPPLPRTAQGKLWIDALLARSSRFRIACCSCPRCATANAHDSFGLLWMLLLHRHVCQLVDDVCRLAAAINGDLGNVGH